VPIDICANPCRAVPTNVTFAGDLGDVDIMGVVGTVARRWVFWLLVIAFVWFLVSRFTEVEKLTKTLAQGQWQWMGIAALLQAVHFLLYAGLYESAFATVGVRVRFRDVLSLVFGALFVNVVVPTGGMGLAGPALFIDDAARRGQSPGRTAIGTLVQLVADYAAFAFVLVIGLAYLFHQRDLRVYEIAGSIILMALIVVLSGSLLLGLWHPLALGRIMLWLERTVSWLAAKARRRSPLSPGWAQKRTDEFSAATEAVARHRYEPLRTVGIALAAYVADLACLYALFLAFHQPVKLGPLVAGFAMGMVFWIVSITPEGIGVVEGVMTLVYTSLGVPAEAAALVSLSFRGLTFYIPVVIGFFLLRRMKSFRRQE